MIHIICIKWGTKYNSDYVNKLYKGIVNNTTISFSFVCYTDDPSGIEPGLSASLPLSKLQGWWNKISMFDSNLHGYVISNINLGDRLFYIDLDTIITGNIDSILQADKNFIVLSDPYRYNTNFIGSGLMSWRHGEHDYLYQEFKTVSGYGGGDQQYIRDNIKIKLTRWQDLFPGQILSYKVETLNKLPKETKIVYFHGIPNPHEITHLDWVKKYWYDL